MSETLVILRQGEPLVVLRERQVPLVIEREVPTAITIERSGAQFNNADTTINQYYPETIVEPADPGDLTLIFDNKLI